MKRLIAILISLFAVVLLSAQAYAAAAPATITKTDIRVVNEVSKRVLTLTWTATAGALGDTTISASDYGIAGFR